MILRLGKPRIKTLETNIAHERSGDLDLFMDMTIRCIRFIKTCRVINIQSSNVLDLISDLANLEFTLSGYLESDLVALTRGSDRLSTVL